MLLKVNISKIEIHSDEWYAGRLAKMTASEWHHCMGDKWPTEGALRYLYRKCGEELSGIPCRDSVETEATKHGLMYENIAIRKYADKVGLKFVVTQALIFEPGSRFACTPDFLIAHRYDSKRKAYEVTTGEIKCPLTFDGYIGLALCNTPADVKAFKKEYYHQVLFQMAICGALKGLLIAYHPDFKAGGMKVIEFRKVELLDEFTLIEQRKILALAKFEEIRDKLLKMK